MKSTLNIEVSGNSIESKDIIATAKKLWVGEGETKRKIKDLENLDLYVKPEENMVYYVFNGEETGSFPLF